MVYYFTWEHDVPSLPPRWEQLLSPERVHKAMQYKRESDRRLCAWSFLLLRYALFCEYKTLDMPHWIYDENGKPHDSQKKYCFNISHCDTAVACAVDTREIGVDVQLPIQRMTWQDAMDRYGSDKPDTRFGMELKDVSDPNALHEANLLMLDITKAKTKLGWEPRLNAKECTILTSDWYKRYQHEDVYNLCVEEIKKFIGV